MTDSGDQRQPVRDDAHHGFPSGPAMEVVYVCALAASVAGLFFGMHYDSADLGSPYPRARSVATVEVPEGTVPATAYADIRSGNLGPNAAAKTRLLPQVAPTMTQDPVVPGDDVRKRADLTARAARRAFNGAPPTIPHAVDPRESASCVACHGPEGMRVGDVLARPMPHADYASCTQCHVPTEAVTEDERHWLDNSFEGLPAPTAGPRAYPGAPPLIPHSVHMRDHCATCHGWSAADGLKSSHPWRDSCTQCHAPWAERDSQPGAEDDRPFFLPGPLARAPRVEGQ